MQHSAQLRRHGALAAIPVLALLGLLSGTASVAAAGEGTATRPETTESQKKIDVNTATELELVALPRVGPALAHRIVEHRKAVGGFKKVEELANVKGIGEKTMEFLRPLITASTPAPPRASGQAEAGR